MNEVLLDFIVVLVSGTIGVLLSLLKQKFQVKDEQQLQKTIQLLEGRLKHFLWPLYFKLEQLVDLGFVLTERQIIDINKHIFRVLHTHIHLIGEQETVIKVMTYINSFNVWRTSGDNKSKFPFSDARSLHRHIHFRVKKEQERYNDLIGITSEGNFKYNFKQISLQVVLEEIEKIQNKRLSNSNVPRVKFTGV